MSPGSGRSSRARRSGLQAAGAISGFGEVFFRLSEVVSGLLGVFSRLSGLALDSWKVSIGFMEAVSGLLGGGGLSPGSGSSAQCSGEVGSGLGGLSLGPFGPGEGGCPLPLGVGERPPDGVGPHDLAKNSVSFTWVRLRRACS